MFNRIVVAALLGSVVAVSNVAIGADTAFTANWDDANDRVWAGPEFWANPMEDWSVTDGRLVCRGKGNRNVALLTRELTDGVFELTAKVGRAGGKGKPGSVGFRVGMTDEIDDYRAAAMRGKGLNVGIYAKTGALFIGKTNGEKLPDVGVLDGPGVTLTLMGAPAKDGQIALTLTAKDSNGKTLATTTALSAPLKGVVALVNNHSAKDAPAFWFDDVKLSGDGAKAHDDRAWGPILWTMHTVHHTHGKDGVVLKMTAQLVPMGDKDPKQATLAFNTRDALAKADVDPLACTATFRVTNWDPTKASKYTVQYNGAKYEGTIRVEPSGRPLAVAGFTGNTDYLFPNPLVAGNVAKQNPDMLFFSGDQLYEFVGGYGIVRAPTDTADEATIRRASLNYLRKLYLWGWSFGDLMRDRPTIVLPDDHDVYQGNIWGEGGLNAHGIRGHSKGGFAEHPAFVNMVIRTQCAHHPDLPDPKPMGQGINVFFGDMLYGGVSFALLEDRYFKSGPQDKVNTWKGRPDHLRDPNYDMKKLDRPGLELLGKRQEEFLRKWAGDWRGAEFKCVLSQTIFCNLANYHGPGKQFIFADLDSNGWPMSGRKRALEAMRSGYAFHYAGDQHLPSITRNGIDTWNDAGYAFCVPSIAAGYPRSWLPDKEGRPVQNRPDPGLPNTGEYRDGFGNYVTVYAIGNPAEKNRPGAENTGHDKSSGHGMVYFDAAKQTIKMECWRLRFDANHPKKGDQFPGWPRTVKLRDMDGRKVAGHLPEMTAPEGIDRPVLRVSRGGKLLYAVRLTERTVKPWFYAGSLEGKYQAELGDGDKWTKKTTTLKN